MAKTNEYLRECLADAVLALLKEKPAGKITADEIVERAGVGRATYFRAFGSKGGAKSEAVTYKMIRLWEHWSAQHDVAVRNRFDIANALTFFEYNYSIRHVLDIIYAAGMQEAVHESFTRIMMPEEGHSYREQFYAHGLYGLLDGWIRRGYQETPEEMAEILREIVGKPHEE